MRNVTIPGFEVAKPEKITSLQISSTGLEKTGKTHFAMTAPGPLAYLRVSERGDRGVVDKFLRDKQVLKSSIVYPRKGNKNLYTSIWSECRKRYEDALDSGARSLVVDTATGMWELCRLARLGKLTQVKPHHYAEVNAEFQGLIDAAFDKDCNVVFVHKSKKQYANDNWNGKYERAGFGDLDFIVPVVLEHFKHPKNHAFGLRVTECRYDHSLEMEEFDEECDFAMLAQEIFPESDASLWR